MGTPQQVGRMERQGLTILVEEGSVLNFASDRAGLAPLQDVAFDHPELLDGADVAMPAVGLAAAYLLIFGKVGRVHAGTMTSAARGAFKEEGIEHEAGSFVRTLPKGILEDVADYEGLAKESVTPLAFVEVLKRRGT